MIHVTTSSMGEDDAVSIAVEWSVDASFNLLIIVYYLYCEIESHMNLIHMVDLSNSKKKKKIHGGPGRGCSCNIQVNSKVWLLG